MPGKQETHYFKIGLFSISAIVLLIFLIVLFSSASLFNKEELIETYFNESVQGLSVGSPVKYRGIIVGQIKKIDFVNNVYHLKPDKNNADRYVYVLMGITSNFVTEMSDEELRQDVKEGLRVKLALQDLVGNAYVEINFLKPSHNPKLPIYWKPRYDYIPSAMSTFTRFTDSIQNVLQGLQGVNFQKFFKDMQNLMTNTDQMIRRMDHTFTLTQGNIVNTFQNVEATSNNVRQLVGTLKENPAKLLFSKPQPINQAEL